MLAGYLRPALPRRPVLYLMAPMTLYGSPVLEAAREYPFAALTGSQPRVEVCEDLYRSNDEWGALWPLVSRRADCGVFLDHLNGWVARGTWAEVTGLLAMGKPVWWLRDGEPAERFGFGPPRKGDWSYRYRRVGVGYSRPCRSVRTRPLLPQEAVEAMP
jgi:hypothetical protein